ncbi:MAG: zinc-ribbon and DUF3426 domain-containing protein [Xanthomonadales bacterium]|jgi:predicted Zn finger-like uncharacterized protein|nr:zinc-ribbon and DUF3426 domain-containing protein [Xanthomonadales bacterium]
MYTLCPQCETAHSLDARQLATAGGKVRCVRCGMTFQALDALYDQYPDRRQAPHKRQPDAAPPELGRKPAPRLPAHTDTPPVQPETPRWPWIALLAVLAVATAINLAWTARDLVPRDGELAATLHRWSVPGFEPPPPYRDPSRIHLLTRDMHDHPTRPRVLVLSATFVNLSDRSQPYPEVMVALKDPEDRVLAARVFAPGDYLIQPPGPDAELASGQQVPLLLEFADPGERATGFELTFR